MIGTRPPASPTPDPRAPAIDPARPCLRGPPQGASSRWDLDRLAAAAPDNRWQNDFQAPITISAPTWKLNPFGRFLAAPLSFGALILWAGAPPDHACPILPFPREAFVASFSGGRARVGVRRRAFSEGLCRRILRTGRSAHEDGQAGTGPCRSGEEQCDRKMEKKKERRENATPDAARTPHSRPRSRG
jgi:hypothetical protein